MKRRVVFMGTPQFAVPTLVALLAYHDVVAVYSQPPRPAGRGQKEMPSAVQRIAEAHGIPVHTPTTLKTAEIQNQFAAHRADVAVVAAYGLLLPKPILDAPRFGCLNLHPSALPRWRGAAPIQHTVLAGDPITEVCVMRMDEGLDTGPVLVRWPFPVPPDATTDTLHDALATVGAAMVLEALENLETLTPQPQADEGITYAHKFTKEHGHLDWREPAEALARRVRALSAYCLHDGETLKILTAEAVPTAHAVTPGTLLDDRLLVACGTGALRLLTVQRAGKKPMTAEELLRGYKISAGDVLR